MNRFAAVVFVALCPALFGQSETPKPDQANVTKLVHLQYAIPTAVANLMNAGAYPQVPVPGALPPDHPMNVGLKSQVFVAGDNGLRAVLLKGTPEAVASAEQLVKQLDVPSARESERDIEVVVYVIGASAKTQSQTVEPKDLEPVIRQLQSLFPYSNYQLLDSMALRSGEGQNVSTQGIMRDFPNAENSAPSNYVVFYKAMSTSSAGKATIRFENFNFETRSGKYPIEVKTGLDVQPGQKVVVGKTNIDGGESALFVVLTAKLLE